MGSDGESEDASEGCARQGDGVGRPKVKEGQTAGSGYLSKSEPSVKSRWRCDGLEASDSDERDWRRAVTSIQGSGVESVDASSAPLWWQMQWED
jgi:hypothetical protein